jgi:hypothetical protein
MMAALASEGGAMEVPRRLIDRDSAPTPAAGTGIVTVTAAHPRVLGVPLQAAGSVSRPALRPVNLRSH